MMLCGPVRHSVDPKVLAKIEPFDHLVQVKVTNFMPAVKDVGEDGEADYLELCRELVADSSRNRAIVADVLSAVAEDVCENLASVLDGIQYNWGNRA